jgi:microcystin-dependent protein
MSQPYTGEIRMFAGTFAPAGWAFCDGSLQSISDNFALFTLLGTRYGGDGQVTFALPDLIGQAGGVESVTLTVNQIPAHTHALTAAQSLGTQNAPAGNVLGESPGGVQPYIEDAPSVNLSAQAITAAGGSQPHTNMQPFLCISFIISLYGIFPPPNYFDLKK